MHRIAVLDRPLDHLERIAACAPSPSASAAARGSDAVSAAHADETVEVLRKRTPLLWRADKRSYARVALSASTDSLGEWWASAVRYVLRGTPQTLASVSAIHARRTAAVINGLGAAGEFAALLLDGMRPADLARGAAVRMAQLSRARDQHMLRHLAVAYDSTGEAAVQPLLHALRSEGWLLLTLHFSTQQHDTVTVGFADGSTLSTHAAHALVLLSSASLVGGSCTSWLAYIVAAVVHTSGRQLLEPPIATDVEQCEDSWPFSPPFHLFNAA
jgi:hypothetical protein